MGRLSEKPKSVSAKPAKSAGERKRRRLASLRRYDRSPRGRYRQQKANAKRRGIVWNLTFLEWCEVWENSGQWDRRGINADCFVMGRRGDTGAYEVGNVEIVPITENALQSVVRREAKRWNPDEDWQHVHNAEGID